MSIQKKSDKISDQYYKDASKGLSGNDPLMQTFYKEMSAEYNKKLDVKPHKRKDLMDFFHEGAEHIMSQAHPASVVIADAMDDGGLIENNIEHYNISREIAYRKPMGNFK
jgi:methyltransferase-like protein